MQRYFLKAIAAEAADALAVCTGWDAREWWAVRPSEGNLKTRTLGLVSSIAAGLAFALPHRKVIAIDGDGAFLMNFCRLPTIALKARRILSTFFSTTNAMTPQEEAQPPPTLPTQWLSPEAPATNMPPGSAHRRNSVPSLLKPGSEPS